MFEIFLRVGLGVVHAGAALAKLAAPRESIGAMASYGFPEGAVRSIAWAALIAVEIALAVAVALGSDGAAYATAALMAVFAVLMTSALIRGRAGAPCACFGARSKISWLGVARNLALAGAFAAVPAIGSSSLSTEGWLAVGVGVALIACAALAIAILALAREVGMLRLQLGTQGALEIAGEGPEVGSRAESLVARVWSAGTASGADRRLGLAVFTSEGCHLCQTLAPAIENVARDPHVAVASFDEVADAALWRGLGIPGSPFALAMDRGGIVLAKGTFNNLAQLESVLATAERRKAKGVSQTDDPAEAHRGRVPVGA
jgi:hypothetical protein